MVFCHTCVVFCHCCVVFCHTCCVVFCHTCCVVFLPHLLCGFLPHLLCSFFATLVVCFFATLVVWFFATLVVWFFATLLCGFICCISPSLKCFVMVDHVNSFLQSVPLFLLVPACSCLLLCLEKWLLFCVTFCVLVNPSNLCRFQVLLRVWLYRLWK